VPFRLKQICKIVLERNNIFLGNGSTSAGTIGAFTAVAARSPLSAPITASAISRATPSCRGAVQEFFQ